MIEEYDFGITADPADIDSIIDGFKNNVYCIGSTNISMGETCA